MDESTIDALNKALDGFDERARKQRIESEASREASARRDLEFGRHRDAVIEPVLQKFKALLSDRGHEANVSKTDRGEGSYSSISLSLVPSGVELERRGAIYPGISFTLQTTGGVSVHEDTRVPGKSGMSLSKGPFSLEELTGSKVQELTLEAIKEILGK